MKKIFSVFLSVLLALTLILPVAACSGGGDDTDGYSVTVKSLGGTSLANVTVSLYDGDSLAGSGETNNKGTATIGAAAGEYDIVLTGIPMGYSQPDKHYKTDLEKTPVTITLSSQVITDTAIPSNYLYALGDIMYDFSVKTSDGEYFILSEVLQSKKAVLINFWATWCGPCLSEMPGLEAAYQEFREDVAVIALSSYDLNSEIASFKTQYGYTFDLANDSVALSENFGVSSIPVSIMIDRYGMVCYQSVGAESQEEFRALFSKYTADDYGQADYNGSDDGEETERELPDVSMPSSETLLAAAAGTNYDGTAFTGTFSGEDEDEYSWPWLTGTDANGKTYIYAANKGHQNSSYATFYLTYEAAAGDVLAFDYFISAEDSYDILYVIQDGVLLNSFTGISDANRGWTTCYVYVPEKAGTYKIGFLYMKDNADPEDMIETDDVQIRNIRFAAQSELESAGALLDVRYQCSTDLAEDGSRYENYITPVLNSADGFYHVGAEDGPVILANMIYTNTHWSNMSILEYVYYGYCVYTVDGTEIDDTDLLYDYANYATNSDAYGFVPVTEELKEALVRLTENLGGENHDAYEDEWLELCEYYRHYGAAHADGDICLQDEDPIAGLAPFNAYTVYETDENGIITGTADKRNEVSISKVTYPRGIYYAFTPAENAVYKFQSYDNVNSDGQIDYTEGWLFDGDGNMISSAEYSATDADGGDSNFIIYAGLEAGKTYYLRLDFFLSGVLGTYKLIITNEGEEVKCLTACTNQYTFDAEWAEQYDEYLIMVNKNVGDVRFSAQDGYYHDVESGSIIYADFTYYNDYCNYTIQSMIGTRLFHYVFDENGEFVQDEETGEWKREQATWNTFDFSNLSSFIYRDGNGELLHDEDWYIDYTDAMKNYLAIALENDGLVPVDETLYKILTLFVERESGLADPYASFIEDEWLMLCRFYRTYSAPAENQD